MRDYEILFIVRPELEEEQVVAEAAKVSELIENLGGAAVKTNVWGKRRLAYVVKHLREGHFVLTDFELEPARVPELEATLKISETIFRHMVVVKPRRKVVAAPAEPTPEPAVEPAADELVAVAPAAASEQKEEST